MLPTCGCWRALRLFTRPAFVRAVGVVARLAASCRGAVTRPAACCRGQCPQGGAPGKMRCIAGCRGGAGIPCGCWRVGAPRGPAVVGAVACPARPAVAGAVAHPAMLHGHASCCRSQCRHKTERKAGSTLRSSRAVPHPSTNRALRRLTSEVGRDPVHSRGMAVSEGWSEMRNCLGRRVPLRSGYATAGVA